MFICIRNRHKLYEIAGSPGENNPGLPAIIIFYQRLYEVPMLTHNPKVDNEGNQAEKEEIYKDSGNLLACKAMTFRYNGFNQLSTMQDTDNHFTFYTYNGSDLRTEKETVDKTIQYYYDGNANIIMETDAYNAVTAKNVRGIHLISRKNEGKDPFYYIHDAHGDVTKLLDEFAYVIKDYRCDPYGNEEIAPFNALGGNITSALWQKELEEIDNPFRYCGEYLDQETGNYYLRARYYDPSTERFISEDSNNGLFNNPLSLNQYTYCFNNPIRYYDQSGNFPVETILDVASLGWSFSDFVRNPSLANFGFLMWDVAAVVTPYAPGSYSIKAGTKILSTADEYVKTGALGQ